MGEIKKTGAASSYTPTSKVIRPVLGGSGNATLTPTKTTTTPTTGNPEAFKNAQKQTEKTLGSGGGGHTKVSGGDHSGDHTQISGGDHGGTHHGASLIYGDTHKDHDKPAVISHKTHLAHGGAELIVEGAEKAAHVLGHGKTGHMAHVVGHGAHKLAGKIGPLGAVASIANAVNNPSVKSIGEATSTTLTATKDIIKGRSTVAATKAATDVLLKAGGRSGSTVTATIVKKEAPKVAAAVAKAVQTGKTATRVAEATKVATTALVKTGVKTTAAVVVKAAPAAAKAAGVAAAKAGGRFVPGLNIAIAAVDVVVAGADIKKAYDKPTAKNVTVAVVSSITAVGSVLAATNIPVVSQIGAGVSLVTGLGKAALESFWPD